MNKVKIIFKQFKMQHSKLVQTPSTHLTIHLLNYLPTHLLTQYPTHPLTHLPF